VMMQFRDPERRGQQAARSHEIEVYIPTDFCLLKLMSTLTSPPSSTGAASIYIERQGAIFDIED
jgi:hypothetical protein